MDRPEDVVVGLAVLKATGWSALKAGKRPGDRYSSGESFVAIDRHSQGRIRAHRQNLALAGVIAAQLADNTPLAVHELALLHVAQPGDPRPWRGGAKPIRTAPPTAPK